MATGLQSAVRSTTREMHSPVARMGVEPTESPGLSRAALPVCVPCRRSHLHLSFRRVRSADHAGRYTRSAERTLLDPIHYPGWDSNPQSPGFKPGRSAGWRTWASHRGGSRGTRTHKRPDAATRFQDRPLIRPDGFRRVARVPGAGIEPAASTFRAWRHYQQQLPRMSHRHDSGRRIRTSIA